MWILQINVYNKSSILLETISAGISGSDISCVVPSWPLPEGFKLISSEPKVTDQKPRLIEGKSFTVLEWAIQDIRPDQMVEIKYTIKGEPGAVYKAKETQALLTA